PSSPPGKNIPQNRDHGYDQKLPHLIFQDIPPLRIGHHHYKPGAQTSRGGKPEPVQGIQSHVIDHSADHRHCDAEKSKYLYQLPAFLAVFTSAPGKVVSFFPAGDLFLFQYPEEISLDAVVRDLGSKAEKKFLPIAAGTELDGVWAGKKPDSF